MSEWKITRRRGVCSACEREFEDGERHVSTLRISPEGFARAELCGAWWRRRPEDATSAACRTACQARVAQGDEAGVEDLFWWFSRHSVAPRRTLKLDLESLERLFVELEGRAEPRLRELRYVLCLLLMRKRRLKVDRIERSPEGESFLVHRPRREETFRVFVYDFSPARMDEIRAELQTIFDGAEPLGETPGEGIEPGAGSPEEAEPEPEAEPERDADGGRVVPSGARGAVQGEP
jgi:hypothetical protein